MYRSSAPAVAASQSTSGKDEKQETSHFNKYEGMSDIGHFMVTTAIHTAVTTTISHGYHRPPSHTAITDCHLTQRSTAYHHTYLLISTPKIPNQTVNCNQL
jgi:hypothetical protein